MKDYDSIYRSTPFVTMSTNATVSCDGDRDVCVESGD
jgi:hypothetical protein